MAREIGGNHGAPEDTESVWEAWINDRPFTFRKTRQKGRRLSLQLRKDRRHQISHQFLQREESDSRGTGGSAAIHRFYLCYDVRIRSFPPLCVGLYRSSRLAGYFVTYY